MKTNTSTSPSTSVGNFTTSSAVRPAHFLAAGFALLSACFIFTGCQSSNDVSTPLAEAKAGEADTIIAGDVLKINFVGAPMLDTQQEVRRDGRISMPVAGEVVAGGLTPAQLAADLSKRFASELLSNEVVVTVVSSAFSVHVSGAVLKPGKYASKGPMTALEAVMEAGGFDSAKANMKRVVVVRHENGKIQDFVLDLSKPLTGKPSEPFYLKPADIVYVPTRFVWF